MRKFSMFLLSLQLNKVVKTNKTMKTLETKIEDQYKLFFDSVEIDHNTGILGKVEDDLKDKIRFSGYPYIGTQYLNAKKKILFFGSDMGTDELADQNTYDNLETRRSAVRRPSVLDHHQLIGAIYTISLGILKDNKSWNNAYVELMMHENREIKNVLKSEDICEILPPEVLDYVAFSNVHKFVTVGRDRRSGVKNRGWYNKEEEIELFCKEIEILAPDIIVFMGESEISNNKKILLEKLDSSKVIVKWMTHPSARAKKDKIVGRFNKIVNDIKLRF